jgi:ABC-type sugar transport system permease subunit
MSNRISAIAPRNLNVSSAPDLVRADTSPSTSRATDFKRGRRLSGGIRDAGTGFGLMLPAVLTILAISLIPVIQTFALSVRNATLGGATDQFTGFANLQRLVADDGFWNAWVQTMHFTVASVVLETVLGLLFALLLNVKFPGRGWVRAAVLIPWAIPTVVTSRMFGWLFDGQNGLVNHILVSLGIIRENINFLGSPDTAMWTIIAADVWKTTPFMALLILAALQTIPQSLRESARVDGASALRTFRSIVLPMVAAPVLIAILLRTLDAFRVFDLPYVLTGGGPANSTETLSTFAYKRLFAASEFGYGSTIATATFATEIALAAIFGFLIIRRYRALEGR